MFLVAALAVALPCIALAGEPVPMNDRDLDAVAAGRLDIGVIAGLSTEQILAHPQYNQAIARLRSDTVLQAQAKAFLATVPASILAQNDAKIRAVLPEDLRGLLLPSR
jgi:hypothetical protein